MPLHHSITLLRSSQAGRRLAAVAAAGGIAVAVAAPAAPARPLPADHDWSRVQVACYQLNPVPPRKPRGYHRVRC
jgi:hypothetical protein